MSRTVINKAKNETIRLAWDIVNDLLTDSQLDVKLKGREKTIREMYDIVRLAKDNA